MNTSDSYKKGTCCVDADCFAIDDNNLCWGQVNVSDLECLDDNNDYYQWIHACKGHENLKNYKKELC